MTNKPMLSVELLPCPMCSGKVREPVAKHIGHGDFCFVVSCNCGLSFDGGQDIESAVRTWNRRATPAAQHQGEPVAEVYRGPVSGTNRIRWVNSRTQPVGAKLYAEQPAPVAVVMPEQLIAAIEAEQERLSQEDYLMDSDECVQVIREEAARLNGVKP